MLVSETIRPSADLRNHYNEVSKLCREENEVVIITVNGKGDTVSMSYEEYQRMKVKLEMLEVLARSEEDADNRRVAPIKETFSDIRKRLEEMQSKEVQNMLLLAEKYAVADLNAVKSYERKKGIEEGDEKGRNERDAELISKWRAQGKTEEEIKFLLG